MNNTKKAKRALLSSVMATLICVAMLIGTTFAWFTDNASTAVNKIQAGTLKIGLEMEDGDNWVNAEGETLGWIAADGRAQDEIFWEPGCTYKLPTLKIINNGNLALQFKILINGISGDMELLNALEFTCTYANEAYTSTPVTIQGSDIVNLPYELPGDPYVPSQALIDKFGIKGSLLPYSGYIEEYDANVAYYTIEAHMKEEAGNEYQGKALENISITVVATQIASFEYDSNGDTYDKDATYLMYPSGVTAASFEAATSVEYTNNLGEPVTGDKPAVAAYVDSAGNVKYVADIYAAVKRGATEIYCKQNATLKMRVNDTNRSPDLTDNLTIYANGADFQYGEISMNMTAAGKASPITLKVYDAKNIKVWGATPNDGVTQTIVMENCTNIGQGRTQGAGILMYITGNTGTVNATVKDCYVTANSSGIYMSTNGSLTVTGSTFVDCATGIKSSYKGAGTRTDRIENCVFTNCGCTAEMAGDTAWLKDDSAAYKYKNSGTGTISLTTKGNTITGTIGDKGDIQIADNVTVINE